ncbi:beta strand repeat-containing protein, partial [Acidisphaera rubrifaciens]|uniref:beta strand repeat-containing protein n=1 Tax=Acidisphaera rubrifaciens TaxID=50715 RepID=UPI0006626595
GGTGTLDVATAPPVTPPPLPPAALAAWSGLLSNSVTLLATVDNAQTTGGDGVFEIAATGTTSTGPTALDTGLTTDTFLAQGIAVDAAAGKYFFTYYDSSSTANVSKLVIGNLAGGGTTTLSMSSLGLTPGTDFINGLAVDQAAGALYLAISSNTLGNNGIWKTSEDGGPATPVATSASIGNVTDLALDKPDGLVFFVDQGDLGLQLGTNNLDVATIGGGKITTLLVGSTLTTDAQITNLAVDSADHLIYYTAHAQSSHTSGATFTTTNTINRVSYGVSGGNVTIGTPQTLYTVAYSSQATEAITGIQLDLPAGTFYVENAAGTNILQGSLAGGSPLVPVVNSGITTGGEPEYLAIDIAPTIAASGTVSFTQGGNAVAADATATVVSPNGQNLAGATVHVSGGTFSGDGDTLAAVTAGTGISAAYNAATETLTLSGDDTAAHYTQVLDSLTFATGSTNPSNGGADPTRTLTWSVTDGLTASASATSVVALQFSPIVTAGATVTYTPGGGAVPADPSLAIAAPPGDTILGASVAISSGEQATDTLTYTGHAGISGAFAGGVLTFTGAASVATYQTLLDSVAYASSLPDPTDGGTDPKRTLTWTVRDPAFTSTPATSTVIACFLAGTTLL